jgi:hypothetical protein
MTTRDAILALFTSDDVVLRPSEIIRRTRLGTYAVRQTLKRLAKKGQLFHIGHSQYARSATTPPLRMLRSGDAKELSRRLADVEARIAKLEERWAQRGPQP